MAEENYGALTGLNLDDPQYQGMSPITYNVYKQQTNRPDAYTDQDIQRLYGTGAMPVFEWVRKVKSGEKTYDPQDAYDQSMMEQYQDLTGDDSLSEADIMKQKALQGTAGGIGTVVGAPIGEALASPYYQDMSFGEKVVQGGKNIIQGTPTDALAKASVLSPAQSDILSYSKGTVYQPEFENYATAQKFGLGEEYKLLDQQNTLVPDKSGLFMTSKGDQFKSGFMKQETLDSLNSGTLGKNAGMDVSDVELANTRPDLNLSEPISGGSSSVNSQIGAGGVETALAQQSAAVGSYPGFGDFDPTSVAGKANAYSAGTGALFNFGFRVASGQDVEGAAKSAADAGVVTYLTTALLMGTPLAPFSTIIGGLVGGAVGRVICNELMRQGVMDRKQVLLDYKFTRDYLTPQHVNGYHVWAVWMVKQMRKGKLVGFWSHVAGHRANEIAYIYGERKKPDYLGKLYRKILEPICWTVGAFCKETDWSVLYTKKEI